MSDRTMSLDPTFAEYDAARGDTGDGAWALHVAMRLLRRDVAIEVVRAGLTEDLELVRQTGEPPQELYGEARSHAAELYDRWDSEGRLELATDAIAWRDVPSSGFLAGAFFAVVATVALMLDGSTVTWTAGLIVLPAALGLTTCAALATWHSVRLRSSTVAAGAMAAGLVLLVSTLLAVVLMVSNEHAIGTAGSWRMLLVAAGCLALSRVLARDAVSPTATDGSLDDDTWSARAAGQLRVRADLPEARVRDLVDEARAHAHEAGTSLEAEFGSPERYAASFMPDRSARHRRWALVLGALGALAAVLAIADWWDWSSSALAVLLLGLAATELRRSTR